MLRVVIFALIWRIRLWVVPKCSLRLWKKGVPAIWFAFVSVDACTDDALPVIAGGGVPEICVCVVHSALAQPTQTVRRRVL